MVGINLDTIEAEVGKLSLEELKKQLLDAKVRQSVATKKYYNPEKAKARRQQVAAKFSAMVEKAKELGIYEDLMDEARELADEKLAEEAEEAA